MKGKYTFVNQIQTYMKIQFQNDKIIIFESQLFRTTCSILIGVDAIFLVDPNWLPNEVQFIDHFIRTNYSAKKKFLFFTHSDYDHIIGYGPFISFSTIASQNFVDNPQKSAVVKQINQFDDQYYIKRSYPIVYPTIDLPISGHAISKDLNSFTTIFYQAQGHNFDGLISYFKEHKVLIVGDYLSNIEFPYIYYSSSLYEQTLATIQAIIKNEKVDLLVTGHGDCTNDIQEMKNRIESSYQYIRDLRSCIADGKEFDLGVFLQAYDFPNIMTSFHQKNVALITKELKEIDHTTTLSS